MRLVDRILGMTPAERLLIYQEFTAEQRAMLGVLLDAEIDNPWARYEGKPVDFITQGLGENIWSRQREICQSLVDHQRTAVAACHAPGKSHLSGRIVAWWMATHAPGTALAITIAPTHRQVRNIIWPHIRRCHYLAKLPGEVLTQTWKLGGDVIAYGFSPSPYDEAATQGIHAPNLLIVVDEAGGIGEIVGQALEALMTGGNTRLLLLGNPPTDQEDSWFERCYESPLYNSIRISAYDTPAFTGEEVGLCKTCPPQVGDHLITKHLVDKKWVDDVISEFGADSPFVIARVDAKFPRSTANKAIPYSWCEQASENDHPLEGNHIRLGVDIAADGGDEFVIAQVDGWVASVLHKSSGKINENPVDVAKVVLDHLKAAGAKHVERGIGETPVRVKIDAIGVGWGVTGLLKRWVDEGLADVEWVDIDGIDRITKPEIIGVNVAETAMDPKKFHNTRAELWWNGRSLLQPKTGDPLVDESVMQALRDELGEDADLIPPPTLHVQDVRLEVDRRCLSQMAGPKYKSDSAGRIQIETKDAMRRRGIASPDRAEAVLLALYEPPSNAAPKVAPIGMGQSNTWSPAVSAGPASPSAGALGALGMLGLGGANV